MSWRVEPDPWLGAQIVLSTLFCGVLGWGCARWRGWSPRNRWLGVLLGLHLGPLGWLAILVAPRRRV